MRKLFFHPGRPAGRLFYCLISVLVAVGVSRGAPPGRRRRRPTTISDVIYRADGLSIWALYPRLGVLAALALGFADGLIAMAATTFLLWSRSPLTRGIPLMVPSQLADKARQEDTTYTERR
jgi:hypothetical protein